MSLNFPNNPNVNDTYTFGNLAWIWTGSSWKKYPSPTTDIGVQLSNLDNTKADLNSPTFTGYVEFDGITDFTQSVVIGIDALPNQTNQSGKYLTTDGTDSSWAEIPAGSPHPFSMMG